MRDGLMLREEDLWKRVVTMMGSKPGNDERHWTRRESPNEAIAARARRLVEQEEDNRLTVCFE